MSFDWGSISFLMGWGSIQECGCIQADMVVSFPSKFGNAFCMSDLNANLKSAMKCLVLTSSPNSESLSLIPYYVVANVQNMCTLFVQTQLWA